MYTRVTSLGSAPGYAPPPEQAYAMPVQSPDSGANQSDEPVWDTGSFSDKAIRRGFIRKVGGY